MWQSYPEFNLLSFLDPNNCRNIMKCEAELKELLKDRKRRLYQKPLLFKDKWKRTFQYCKMGPHKTVEPLYNIKRIIVTSING